MTQLSKRQIRNILSSAEKVLIQVSSKYFSSKQVIDTADLYVDNNIDTYNIKDFKQRIQICNIYSASKGDYGFINLYSEYFSDYPQLHTATARIKVLTWKEL